MFGMVTANQTRIVAVCKPITTHISHREGQPNRCGATNAQYDGVPELWLLHHQRHGARDHPLGVLRRAYHATVARRIFTRTSLLYLHQHVPSKICRRVGSTPRLECVAHGQMPSGGSLFPRSIVNFKRNSTQSSGSRGVFLGCAGDRHASTPSTGRHRSHSHSMRLLSNVDRRRVRTFTSVAQVCCE